MGVIEGGVGEEAEEVETEQKMKRVWDEPKC